MNKREATGCRNCEHCVGCVDKIIGATCGAEPFEQELLESLQEDDDSFDIFVRREHEFRVWLMNHAGNYANPKF